ncbi:hypothetical protein B0H17DRAFT_1324343 [Mycena rosella]|uniref:Uncharacterized protein n=1 Tax=Mycena rosella TaxID=1033263 RepID=A0AAD7H3F5_MYCRO|nr:hypothetical protein B0H17DRAFT_1324343 [Mycena rosella]
MPDTVEQVPGTAIPSAAVKRKDRAGNAGKEYDLAKAEYDAVIRRRDHIRARADAGQDNVEGSDEEAEEAAPKESSVCLGKRRTRAAEEDNEEAPSKKKRASRPTGRDKEKGKEPFRNNDLQQDESDPATYEIEPNQNRTIELIIYTESDSEPVQQILDVRHPGDLNLAFLPIAITVKAVTSVGEPGLDYDWFCVFNKTFMPGAFLNPINMLSRGHVLVCRSAVILEMECPGIQDAINKVYESLLGMVKDEYDWEDEVEVISPRADLSTAPSSSLMGSLSGSVPSSSLAMTGRGASSSAMAGPGPSSLAASAAYTSAGNKKWVKREPDLGGDDDIIEISD